MFFFHVFIISFLFFELEPTCLTLYAFAEVYDLDVSIEMMFVPEVHAAVTAFVSFYVGVRDHVTF